MSMEDALKDLEKRLMCLRYESANVEQILVLIRAKIVKGMKERIEVK